MQAHLLIGSEGPDGPRVEALYSKGGQELERGAPSFIVSLTSS